MIEGQEEYFHMIRMAFAHLCWVVLKNKCYFIFFTIPEFIQANLCGCEFLIIRVNNLSLKCRSGSRQAFVLSFSLQGHEFNKVAEHSALKPRRNGTHWERRRWGLTAGWGRAEKLLVVFAMEPNTMLFKNYVRDNYRQRGFTETSFTECAVIVQLGKCCESI